MMMNAAEIFIVYIEGGSCIIYETHFSYKDLHPL